MSLINILTESNFDAIAGTGKVLLDFGAEWCLYCKKIEPILEEIAREKQNTGLKVCSIDVDTQVSLAARFHIRSLPTVLLLRDGNVVKQLIGEKDKNTFLNAIDEL